MTDKVIARVRYYATVHEDGRFPVFLVEVTRTESTVRSREHRNTPIATYPTFQRAIEHCQRVNREMAESR